MELYHWNASVYMGIWGKTSKTDAKQLNKMGCGVRRAKTAAKQ